MFKMDFGHGTPTSIDVSYRGVDVLLAELFLGDTG